VPQIDSLNIPFCSLLLSSASTGLSREKHTESTQEFREGNRRESGVLSRGALLEAFGNKALNLVAVETDFAGAMVDGVQASVLGVP